MSIYNQGNTEDFIRKANQVHNRKYSYEYSIYKNSKTKLIINCPIHGNFEQIPSNHLSGSGCYTCGHLLTNKKLSGSTEKFIHEAILIHKNRYDYSSLMYVNNKTRINIFCNKHKKYFQQTPHDHITKKSGCPACGGNEKLSKELFVHNSKKIHGNKYTYHTAVYKTVTNKLEIFCKKHKKYFWQSPANHIYGKSGCPLCKSSKGEKIIADILETKLIEFKNQYRISECKNKRSLPFDFAIFNKNKLICLIEYQGRQHYVPINFGKSTLNMQLRLEELLERDLIKKNFCEINKIPLLVIPYTEKHIEEKIAKFINSLTGGL